MVPFEGGGKLKQTKIAPEFFDVAEELAGWITNNNSKARVTKKQVQQWADVVRLMVERDGHNLGDITEVMEWSQNDENFWAGVILSMGNLRKHWNRLTTQMMLAQKPRLRESDKCPNCQSLMADCHDHWKCTICNRKYEKPKAKKEE